MKKLIMVLVLTLTLAVTGCGGGGGSSTTAQTPAEIAAAKQATASLATGKWLLAYNIGTSAYTDTMTFGAVSTIDAPPFDFTATTTSVSNHMWLGVYTSTNQTWTLLHTAYIGTTAIGSEEYVFQTDGTQLLAGSCFYAIQANGTKSACYPLTGTKIK